MLPCSSISTRGAACRCRDAQKRINRVPCFFHKIVSLLRVVPQAHPASLCVRRCRACCMRPHTYTIMHPYMCMDAHRRVGMCLHDCVVIWRSNTGVYGLHTTSHLRSDHENVIDRMSGLRIQEQNRTECRNRVCHTRTLPHGYGRMVRPTSEPATHLVRSRLAP